MRVPTDLRKDSDGRTGPNTRNVILAAALEAYSRHGFRGATTRLIAETAGVNEVTIFRQFGSKEALLAEAVGGAGGTQVDVRLPAEPRDPDAELARWAEEHLTELRRTRAIFRMCMSEIEDRRAATQGVAAVPRAAFVELCGYLVRLRDAGLAFNEFDERVTAATLIGALFADATGREMMPNIYPPAATAAREYAAVILRAIGADEHGRSAFADATGAPRG